MAECGAPGTGKWKCHARLRPCRSPGTTRISLALAIALVLAAPAAGWVVSPARAGDGLDWCRGRGAKGRQSLSRPEPIAATAPRHRGRTPPCSLLPWQDGDLGQDSSGLHANGKGDALFDLVKQVPQSALLCLRF